MTPIAQPAVKLRQRWLRAGVAAAVAALVFTTTPALAEKADREKPINLEADRVTVDDAKQISTFEGKVVLTQGTLIIRGDRMEVRQDNQGFKEGVTWGNLAYFRQKRDGYDEYIEGWAERIEYDSRADKMQMFNRASMKKGTDEVRGNYISYDAKTEFFQVIGGGAKAASAENSDGRVRAVIQPKPKDKPAAQSPVPLKPDTNLTAPRGELQAPPN
ncbi:MAG: lipopolysaccharide transport periplasmic protein LptA [Burkholderiales bacterium]|nr:lipopolysaccharide transport periplasmic protein LptA [Burkholderiales bacterium]